MIQIWKQGLNEISAHPCSGSTIQNSQGVEAPLMSTERRTGKGKVEFTHMEYYSGFKGKEILPHATTWMSLEHIMLS